MSTSSIADAQRLLPLEKHAERWALSVLRGTAFTDCLKIIGLAPALEILTTEGNTITMRGSDNYDSGTWKKILASINQQEHKYQQTERGEHLAGQEKARLLHENTTRYRALSAEADLAWFERFIILAMTPHSMEQQCNASTTQGLEIFADPWVAREMGNRLMLNHVVRYPGSSRGACVCTPRQLCLPLRMDSFRFNVRHIKAVRQAPVLAQHAEPEAVALDRERFTQARRSCLEPDRSVGKEPCRRTVSLFQGRVPKPTCISSPTTAEKRKWRTLRLRAPFIPPHAFKGRGFLKGISVKETTRLVHHIVREPTRARQLIAQCYEEHDRQMQARLLVTREPLPALPSGATSPCALLSQKEEERHAGRASIRTTVKGRGR